MFWPVSFVNFDFFVAIKYIYDPHVPQPHTLISLGTNLTLHSNVRSNRKYLRLYAGDVNLVHLGTSSVPLPTLHFSSTCNTNSQPPHGMILVVLLFLRLSLAYPNHSSG
jgi:hypothetical protein